MDLAAFERVALPALGTLRAGGVVVVDELGKMELASAAFRDAVTELLGRDVAVVATVHRARHRLTDALRRRPNIRVIRVTEATRDALPQQLMEYLVGGRTGDSVEHGLQASTGGDWPGQAGGPRARVGPP